MIYAGIGVFSNVGSNIFNLLYSRKFINLFAKTQLNLKRHIKPVMTFFGISVAGKINSALDAVMLGFMLNDAAVKEMITSAICSFMPRSSYYLEHNQIDEYMKIVSSVCNATYFFSIPAAIGLMLLSEPLIFLFSGEAYLPAAPAMKVMSFSIIGMCSTSFLNQIIITPLRKEKFSLLAQSIAVVTNITLNVFLILRLEVLGAAIATTIVEFVLPLVLFFPSFRFLKSLKNLIGIMKSVTGSIVMYLLISAVCGHIENPLAKIGCSIVVGACTYAIVELLLRNETASLLSAMLMKQLKKHFAR